jgi:hypothetical protein
MREHALDTDGADDDASDDRVVRVRVGLERHPDARLAPRVAEPVFRGTGETTSKYSHHRHRAATMPSTAAASSGVLIGWPAAPGSG